MKYNNVVPTALILMKMTNSYHNIVPMALKSPDRDEIMVVGGLIVCYESPVGTTL